MTYIVNSDLYNVYGQANITAWSDLTGGRTLDQDRIDAAIKWAEKYIENRFRRSRYSIPFTRGVDGEFDAQLKNWMATYAGDYLYRARVTRRGQEKDDRTSSLLKKADMEIKQVIGGQMLIDSGTIRTPIPGGPIAIM